MKRDNPEQLEAAEHFLMIPDYLAFLLTGNMANEYTNASTTSLLNARAKDWDQKILETFDIPARIFKDVVMAGTELGMVKPEIAAAIGYMPRVIVPATHDTGSAYLAVPARDDDAVFLSSGTWSLLGIENQGPITSAASRLQNFTNEGGYQGRFRFLKNIMGLWMIQSIRRELNGVSYVEGKEDSASETKPHEAHTQGASVPATDIATKHYELEIEPALKKGQVGFADLIEVARSAEPFSTTINVNDDRLLAPDSMIAPLASSCAACIFRSPSAMRIRSRIWKCSPAARSPRSMWWAAAAKMGISPNSPRVHAASRSMLAPPKEPRSAIWRCR